MSDEFEVDCVMNIIFNLRREIADLKQTFTKQNEIIVNLISEQKKILERTVKWKTSSLDDGYFPIRSQEDLDYFEVLVNDENSDQVVDAAKILINPGGLRKNVRNILSYELISKYNLDGNQGKKRIQDYKKLMDVLYKATQTNIENYGDFLVDLRKGLRIAKNTYHRNTHRKKKEKEKNFNSEFVSCD